MGTDAMMKAIFALVLLVGLAAPALAQEEGGMPAANTEIGNKASLQRGAKLFVNYCLSCHSAQYMRYSRAAEDLGLSEEQTVKNLIFTGTKFGERMTVAMRPSDAEKWFDKAPPDLSLTARSRGVDWVYNYLKSFYVDESRPSGWNNSVLPNAAMPNVLWELQGMQHAVLERDAHGGEPKVAALKVDQPGLMTPAEFDQAARDITTFLQYVGEPAALQRHAYGAWVILFLAFFTFIAYLLKHEYWNDVH